mmetsp:Transcript_24236/g.55930  ORF Transcript_24236/g.55930 Transcript_24236/m.55930 type:complete len:122 (+) Transcript_24236:96-461(+)
MPSKASASTERRRSRPQVARQQQQLQLDSMATPLGALRMHLVVRPAGARECQADAQTTQHRPVVAQHHYMAADHHRSQLRASEMKLMGPASAQRLSHSTRDTRHQVQDMFHMEACHNEIAP